MKRKSKSKSIAMQIVNPNAAGIDVGSKSHYVGIGQGIEHVREFGVYSTDLQDLVDWLKSNGVTSIAMESTGDYWQNLFAVLVNAGFEVSLVNGKFIVDQKRKQLADVRRRMMKLGLNPNEHDVFTRPEYREKWLQSQLKS
jgi:transposase